MAAFSCSITPFEKIGENEYKLTLPVPPSTNRRQTIAFKRARNGDGVGVAARIPFLTLTTEARDFLSLAVWIAPLASINYGFRAIEDYHEFHFQFYLARMNYDTHNGLKLACDLIEKAGLIADDRFVLPQVRRPEKDPENPRLEITF